MGAVVYCVNHHYEIVTSVNEHKIILLIHYILNMSSCFPNCKISHYTLCRIKLINS